MATAAPKHDRSKTAIIVGASRGLGLGLAREFARRGWHCVKKTRKCHAVREMKVGPSESPCRGRHQTAISCFGQKPR